MKKLLSLLTAVSLTSVAATSVVSCTEPKTELPIKIEDGKKQKVGTAKDAYDESDIKNILDKKDKAIYGLGFYSLAQKVAEIISVDANGITKPQNNQQQAREMRNTFLARGSKVDDNDPTKMVSVDGIRFNGLEDDANKFYDYRLDDNNATNHSINSLNAINDALEHDQEEKFVNISSLSEYKSVFSDFIKDFSNSKKNSALTKIDFSGLDLHEYNSKTEKITLKDKNVVVDENGFQEYYKNNDIKKGDEWLTDINKKEEEYKALSTKKINDRSSVDPFGTIVIGDPLELSNTEVVVIEDEDKKLDYIDLAKDASKLEIKLDKDKKNIESMGAKILYKKISNPPIVNLKFSSDTKHDDVADHYKISFTLNNLSQVYVPAIKSITKKPSDNKIEEVVEKQIVWQFDGYKFVDFEKINLSEKGEVNSDKYQEAVKYEINHYFLDYETTDWEIKLINKN